MVIVLEMCKEKIIWMVFQVNKPKIVIIGAGYAGLTTTVRLQKLLHEYEAEIVLVNKNPYHYETTWLHEASAGTLHHDKVRYELIDVIDKHKVQFILGSVKAIQKEDKKVILDNGELTYDYLIVAIGGVPETFGIEGLKEYAFSITDVNSARLIREHIEYQFAKYEKDGEEHNDRITIVVGGAGFTGIEFLGEISNKVPELCKEYDVDYEKVKIICVEAASTALPGFDKELVDYAVATLERKGVEFKLGQAIKKCTRDGIIVAVGEDQVEEIKAATVVWAAGVRGSEIIEKSGIETIRGRVKVDENLRAPGEEDIFVIGDSALIINEETNRPYPPSAQIAVQQAETCAKNISILIKKEGRLQAFTPVLRGSVCSLGHDDGIALVFGKKIFGAKAAIMKKIVDNRSLYKIGGATLVMKKGRL